MVSDLVQPPAYFVFEPEGFGEKKVIFYYSMLAELIFKIFQFAIQHKCKKIGIGWKAVVAGERADAIHFAVVGLVLNR